MNVLMVRSPLLGLEGVEAFACSEAAAIIAAGKPAAAAIPALPTRTRRRDGKRAGVTELSSVVGLMIDTVALPNSKRSGIGGDHRQAAVGCSHSRHPAAIERSVQSGYVRPRIASAYLTSEVSLSPPRVNGRAARNGGQRIRLTLARSTSSSARPFKTALIMNTPKWRA